MIVNTPISIGELLDKISILIIKKKNIDDEKKLSLVKEELNILENSLEELVTNEASFLNNKRLQIEDFKNQLINVNSELWEIEDKIRVCEKNKKFDENFIKLARSVYITNDVRSAIKLDINKKLGSKIVEVKSYDKY